MIEDVISGIDLIVYVIFFKVYIFLFVGIRFFDCFIIVVLILFIVCINLFFESFVLKFGIDFNLLIVLFVWESLCFDIFVIFIL